MKGAIAIFVISYHTLNFHPSASLLQLYVTTPFLQLLLKLEPMLQGILPSTKITVWELGDNINCQKILNKNNKFKNTKSTKTMYLPAKVLDSTGQKN